jgi:hypothetical protein
MARDAVNTLRVYNGTELDLRGPGPTKAKADARAEISQASHRQSSKWSSPAEWLARQLLAPNDN